MFGSKQQASTYVDTPNGIFTASGTWFGTTKAALEGFAGAVLDHEPLDRLIADAEVWLRSPETLSLWLLPVFLYLLPPTAAAFAALVVFVGWKALGPAFVARSLTPALRLLDRVPVQALYYTAALTGLAWSEHYVGVWIGLGGFVVLRWGLVGWVTRPLAGAIHKTLYELPVPDQVLRAVVLRSAMKYHVSMEVLDRMQARILSIWNREKK